MVGYNDLEVITQRVVWIWYCTVLYCISYRLYECFTIHGIVQCCTVIYTDIVQVLGLLTYCLVFHPYDYFTCASSGIVEYSIYTSIVQVLKTSHFLNGESAPAATATHGKSHRNRNIRWRGGERERGRQTIKSSQIGGKIKARRSRRLRKGSLVRQDSLLVMRAPVLQLSLRLISSPDGPTNLPGWLTTTLLMQSLQPPGLL